MKMKLLLCSLGFILAGLLAASPAAAYTIEITDGWWYNSSNSGAATTQDWLEGLAKTGLTPRYEEASPIPWNTSLVFDDGTYYVVLKVGNAKITDGGPNDPNNWDTFAFTLVISGDENITYGALMDSMVSLLNDFPIKDFNGNLIDWADKASHIIIYKASSVPLPAAAWLLGSGILGLAGIRKIGGRLVWTQKK